MDSILGSNDLKDTYKVAPSFKTLHSLVCNEVKERYSTIEQNLYANKSKPVVAWGKRGLEKNKAKIRSGLAEGFLREIGAWKNEEVRESIMYSFPHD